jgi:ubiquinone/menaquinone biosynthesis C-methylase UbiE
MSRFADKIKSKQPVTEADWNRYLVEAHKAAPGMTPAAFAPYKTHSGLTSYEILSQSIENLRNTESHVLDLACGDGHLFPYLLKTLGPTGTVTGVDMSDTELSIARGAYGNEKRVELHQASAQALPMSDGSVDATVCHMALMLMLPLDPVVSEISRVLKTGGTFSAVIGDTRGKSGLFGEIQKITSQFIVARYEKFQNVPSGDSRVQSEAGIRDLFSPKNGFEDSVVISDFSLQVKTNAQGVWNLMKNMYFVSMLPAEENALLERELKAFSTSVADAEGSLSFDFQMRMFTAKKR